MKLYPLKFHPILKERLWGGTRLSDKLGKTIPNEQTGESWELSGVKGDVSVVSHGELQGTSLNDLIEEYGASLLGEEVLARFGKEFPILIKFLDARMDLSIQLHPNDELARKRHNSLGKTEMWYIMDSEPGAKLIIGFKREVERGEYQQKLREGKLLEILNYETVQEGDAFMINTGKIHAIGAGVLLAEIQQTSDITYRVYDFDRRDSQGNRRELHTELALDAIDFSYKDDFRIDYSRKPDSLNKMVHSPYFKTNFLDLTRDWERKVSPEKSFTILMCLAGTAEVSNHSGKALMKTGETVLFPADSGVIGIQTKGAKFLEVTL